MVRSALCLRILLAVVFAGWTLGAPLKAVIFDSTADSNFNITAPSGSLAESGWQWTGAWGNFQGTPVGPRHFLAAKHIGGTVGDVFVLNGTSYRTVGFHDDAETDLRLWRIRESFPSWAPLYRSSNETGRTLMLFGRGFLRGSEVRVAGALKGWQYASSDGRLRWGQNTVTGIVTTGNTWGQVLRANFDAGAGVNEATLATGDSSGPIFIHDGAGWKLAGIGAYVDAFFNTQSSGTGFTAALFDARALYIGAVSGPWTLISASQPVPSAFYATRVSVRTAWIDDILAATPPPNAPLVTVQPVDTVGVEGGSVSFEVVVDGGAPLSYQWYKNGVALANEIRATLTLTSLTPASAGDYHLVSSNAAGSITSAAAKLTVVPPSRLINVSVRARTGLGADTLIVGVAARSPSAKSLLVRAVGPGLIPFGVSNALVDPHLVVYRGSQVAGENDNWSGAASLVSAFAQVGAFALPSTSKDAALLATLPDSSFTAHVTYTSGTSGVALVEVYDTDATPSSASLSNLSARIRVDTPGEPLIAGFVVRGDAPQRVLVRGIGPGLGRFGLSSVLADPKLEVYRDQVLVAANDTWGSTNELKEAFTRVGAFALDERSLDASAIVTLQPGAYTAQVTGPVNTSGIAMIEVYVLPW